MTGVPQVLLLHRACLDGNTTQGWNPLRGRVTGDPDPALWHTRTHDPDLLRFPALMTRRIYKFYVLNHCCYNAETHLLQLPCVTTPVVHPKGPKAFLAEIALFTFEPCLPPSDFHLISKPAQKGVFWLFLCKKAIPVPRCQTKIARLYVKPKHSIKDNGSHFSFMVH